MTNVNTYAEIIVALRLIGTSVDADKISKIIGLTPTETWKKGELRVPGASVRHQDNGWAIEVRSKAILDVDQMFKKLWEKIKSEEKNIIKVIKTLKVEAGIFVIIYAQEGKIPPIFIPATYVQKFATLNTSIDIDFILVD